MTTKLLILSQHLTFFCNIVKTFSMEQNKSLICDATDEKNQVLRPIQNTKNIRVYIYKYIFLHLEMVFFLKKIRNLDEKKSTPHNDKVQANKVK